jgi:hypothetical protein
MQWLKRKQAVWPFSHGAASVVRHIDPATVAVPEIEASKRPEEIEEQVLHDQADQMLHNDMRRRFGKVAGDRAYLQIKAERYVSPEAQEVSLSRAQRKRMRRKKRNAAEARS